MIDCTGQADYTYAMKLVIIRSSLLANSQRDAGESAVASYIPLCTCYTKGTSYGVDVSLSSSLRVELRGSSRGSDLSWR